MATQSYTLGVHCTEVSWDLHDAVIPHHQTLALPPRSTDQVNFRVQSTPSVIRTMLRDRITKKAGTPRENSAVQVTYKNHHSVPK
jgi:hypothetical protein